MGLDWPITLRKRNHPTLPVMLSVGIYERGYIMYLIEERSTEAGSPAAAEFVLGQ